VGGKKEEGFVKVRGGGEGRTGYFSLEGKGVRQGAEGKGGKLRRENVKEKE